MPNHLLDSQLTTLLQSDKTLLEKTRFPIVTVSSTFREDLKQFHGMDHDPFMRDIVFSRAHFSMAFAVAVHTWMSSGADQECPLSEKITAPCDAKTAWLVDPTNYVRSEDWSKIQSTEYIGRKLARNAFLKWVKDQIDTFARNRLPITTAITPPLLHLFEHVEKPIISMHYEAGNILGGIGKRVVQVVTDPHVRDQYLTLSHLKNMRYCVMDEKTKQDFLEKAAIFGKDVDPNRIIVTGPPIDPRVVAARQKKNAFSLKKRPLRLCITTGGLGTNKEEIREMLSLLFDLLRKRPAHIQVLCYGGTNHDFTTMIQDVARDERVAISPLEDDSAPFRLIHGKHIVGLNEQLITYGFAWADGFISKPSGDMAYDAAAAGCFLLFLAPWGEWERNIQEVFEQRGIGRRAQVQHIKEQIELLASPLTQHHESWFAKAQQNALDLPPLFLNGAKKILTVAKEWK
ncbi:MAG: hypothetical protein HZA34_00610 [Candidatus Pacebacteria bacterium]|nr:hypothetical protein [Candidatus Paceibacterota bacterium]